LPKEKGEALSGVILDAIRYFYLAPTASEIAYKSRSPDYCGKSKGLVTKKGRRYLLLVKRGQNDRL